MGFELCWVLNCVGFWVVVWLWVCLVGLGVFLVCLGVGLADLVYGAEFFFEVF